MSKENWSLRLPEGVADDIEAIEDAEGFDTRSDAAREVLRRGIEYSNDTSAGERLAEIATAVSGVGAVVAVIGAVTGGAWAMTLAMPFTIATFVFAMFWASIRALRGGGLL